MQNATLSMSMAARGGGGNANPNSPDAIPMDDNDMVEQRLMD